MHCLRQSLRGLRKVNLSCLRQENISPGIGIFNILYKAISREVILKAVAHKEYFSFSSGEF